MKHETYGKRVLFLANSVKSAFVSLFRRHTECRVGIIRVGQALILNTCVMLVVPAPFCFAGGSSFVDWLRNAVFIAIIVDDLLTDNSCDNRCCHVRRRQHHGVEQLP